MNIIYVVNDNDKELTPDSKLFGTLEKAEEYLSQLSDPTDLKIYAFTFANLKPVRSSDIAGVYFYNGNYITNDPGSFWLTQDDQVNKHNSLQEACFWLMRTDDFHGQITYKGYPLSNELRQYVIEYIRRYDINVSCTIVEAPALMHQPYMLKFSTLAEAARYKRDHMPEGIIHLIDHNGYLSTIINTLQINIIKKEMTDVSQLLQF